MKKSQLTQPLKWHGGKHYLAQMIVALSGGKLLSPARRRQAVEHVQKEKNVSERRACKVLGQSRSSQRYTAQPVSEDTERLTTRLHELAGEHPRWGYRMMTAKLRLEGWRVNFKRVYRLWRQEGLKVPKKTKKRRRIGHSDNGCHRRRVEHKDHVWSWDFIHDRTADGRPLKWLAVTDEYTRECLALEVDRSITSERVMQVLTNLFLTRGVPRHIRSDNGPEFIANALQRGMENAGLEMHYIEPGSLRVFG